MGSVLSGTLPRFLRNTILEDMKNILIPTDFSACAGNAVHAGILLAKRFESRIHLLHTLAPLRARDRNDSRKMAEYEQARENATTLLKEIAGQQADLEFLVNVREGKLPAAISQYVDETGIDMIVMGSHGTSGQNEYFIGSNTQKVVRKVHLPVLVIKDRLENVDFNKVVFATNLNQEEKEAFARFKDFVKHFLPEIHIVYINNDPFFGLPYVHTKELLEEWKVLAKPFECQTHYFSAYTVDQGIRALSEEIGASLVSISNHQRHPMKRMFSGSNVEALVNHAQLPVLSIDY